jgi:hypothetical protein
VRREGQIRSAGEATGAVLDAGKVSADPKRLARLQRNRKRAQPLPLLCRKSRAGKLKCRHFGSSLARVTKRCQAVAWRGSSNTLNSCGFEVFQAEK